MEEYSFLQYMRKNDMDFAKKCVLCILIFIPLFIGLIWIDNYRVGQNQKTWKAKIESSKIGQAITEYQQNVSALQNGSVKKPILRNEVEQYQSNLIKKLEANKLAVQNIATIAVTSESSSPKNNTEQNKSSGVEYEVTAIGTWEAIMKILVDFEAEPIAVNLKTVKIEAQTDSVNLKTVFRYKVYTTD